MKTLKTSRKNYFFVDTDGVHGWLSASPKADIKTGERIKLEIYVEVLEARREANPDGDNVLGIDFAII